MPVAMVGAVRPVNLIKAGDLRGVASNGMICSLAELGLATESEGIAVLDDLADDCPAPGAPVAPLLGLDDTVLELAITANRPDGLSMVGIAREVAALTGAELNLPQLTLQPDHATLEPAPESAEAMLAGGLYGLTLIDGVDGAVGSPAWVQQRLERAGINRVNAVVDITNVVMLEQGQPCMPLTPMRLSSSPGNRCRRGISVCGRPATEKRSLDSMSGNCAWTTVRRL